MPVGTDTSIEPQPVRRRRGRPATASRDDVLRLARDQCLSGRRVDITLVARNLGLGRATIYRWFGSREALLGEIVAGELEGLIAHHRQAVTEPGAPGLLDVFDRVNRSLARSQALRALLEQERHAALRMLTSSGGPVQPRAVASVRTLIEGQATSGAYRPPTEPAALAYAIVRLAEAFLYNDVAFGIRGDWQRLRQVEAALLGVPAAGDDGPRPAHRRAPVTPRRAAARTTGPGRVATRFSSDA